MQYAQIWDADDPENAPFDREQTLAALRTIDADIILLQEVEKVDVQNGQIQPPPNFTFLRQQLNDYDGFFAYPEPNANELPFGYGLAIFSRTQLVNTHAINLPAPNLTFDFFGVQKHPTNRVMIGAQTRIEGQLLQLFNCHLQAFFVIGKTSDDYPEQRELVRNTIQRSALPTLLGGDFNSAPSEGTVATIESAGFRSIQRDKATWKRNHFVLDHLFHNKQVQVLNHQLISTQASDHDLLIADINF
jgi:endonuclease/exonuclease/phosphatase family metal-dependent hydrolase